MDNIRKLNFDEMEKVIGGAGGSPTPPKRTPKTDVYRIKSNDTLSKIAVLYNTTETKLLSLNPSLKMFEALTPDYYILVPRNK